MTGTVTVGEHTLRFRAVWGAPRFGVRPCYTVTVWAPDGTERRRECIRERMVETVHALAREVTGVDD